MLLHTFPYLVFLLVIGLITWQLPRISQRKYLWLAASYAFYSAFDIRFSLLLALLTVCVYLIGRQISHSPQAKFYLILSIIINLSFLGIFKYLNFFLDTASIGIFGLRGVISSPGLRLILPIGISFYTFQAISYTNELYLKKIKTAIRFWDFALFMAFFPKLIAGPLIKPTNFMEQLENVQLKPGRKDVVASINLLLLGLFKKIIIADSLGSLSSTAFHAAATGQALSFNTPLYIQGFYLFAFEIYADFSGYIDIARASAALLGIQLPENFKQPYLATSLGVFWNRWNMTLTQWFREYLYFPLTRALSQRTERRHPQLVQVITNLITMLLIGLWHGPAWTFIAWGGWHGCLLSIESMLKIKPASVRHSLIQGIITFHLVGIGWVLFRSESLTAAVNYLHALFAFNNMEWLPYYLPSIILTAALVFGIDLLTVYQARLGRLSYLKEFRPALVIASLILLSSLFILTFARGSAVRPFIYGQF